MEGKLNALEGRMEGRINALEGRMNALETIVEELKAETKEMHQELKEITRILGRRIRNQDRSLERSEKFVMKGKKEVKKGRVARQDSLVDIKKAKEPSNGGENSNSWEKKRETDISAEDGVDEDHEGDVVTITSGSRVSEVVVLRVDCFTEIRGQDRREENICEGEGKDENYDGNIVGVAAEKVAKSTAFSGDSMVGCGVYLKTVKKGEEVEAWGQNSELASSNGHKGISRFLAESLLTSHLVLLTMVEGKDGKKETLGMEAVQTVLEQTPILVLYNVKGHQVRKQYRTVIWSMGILEKKRFLLMEQKESIILSYQPPPQASRLELEGSSKWVPFI
ncbi:hypothetical protein LR48_Vigan09g005800 [Vigna angularis]|uniref:Uncharacterized protein n=1 Tax=Phaseolus angularis TaxID=3914 RepID=A0A0L9V9T3_PHAAN|nr:hypothetical protein LR48_Vigan09g005800 [Vigna angularis]